MKIPRPRIGLHEIPPERSRLFLLILMVVALFVVALLVTFTELLSNETRKAEVDKAAAFAVAEIEADYLSFLETLDRFEYADPEVPHARVRASYEALRRRLSGVLQGRKGPVARRRDSLAAVAEALDRALVDVGGLLGEIRPGDEEAFRKIHMKLDPLGASIRKAVVDLRVRGRWDDSAHATGLSPMVLGIAIAFVGMLLGGGSLVYLLISEVRRTTGLLNKTTEAEARTVRAETHLIDALESIPQGVALFDADDRLILCNRSYRDIVANGRVSPEPGTAFAELCRAMVEERRIVEAQNDPETWLAERIARHRQTSNREEIRLTDGRWVHITERRIRNGDIISVLADVTDVKMREAVLNEARQHAELASRAKSEFLANMSHELRTPLNAIIGFSEMIRDEAFGPLPSPKYVEYAADIHASGEHLLELINDILDISKIEAGELKLHEEEFDVLRIARACIQFVAKRARDNGLTLDCDLPDDFPRLYADACKVKQILINLLSNAVKFTEEGGRVSLRVRLREDGGIELAITDTGIGIARKDLKLIMKPFTQVDSKLARKYEGTGLGLPLCKSLLDLHGGRLEIESEIGVGTTARAIFPPSRTRPRA